MLMEQRYPGMGDHIAHFDWLLRAFTDRRYLTVDGKPIFVIYRPDDIPDVLKVTELWRERAVKAGLPGLYLIGVSHYQQHWDPRPRGLDASTMQALPERTGHIPWRHLSTKIKLALQGNKHELTIWDYQEVLPILLRTHQVDWSDYPIVLPNWDNTPRSGMRGLVLENATPDLFRGLLRQAIDRVSDRAADERIVFLKAWNEWAEGNYVEPDQKWGRAWLEAIREELRR
jgi:hypothetical protein